MDLKLNRIAVNTPGVNSLTKMKPTTPNPIIIGMKALLNLILVKGLSEISETILCIQDIWQSITNVLIIVCYVKAIFD